MVGKRVQESVLDQGGKAAGAGRRVVPEGVDVVLGKTVVSKVSVLGGRVCFRDDEEVVVVEEGDGVDNFRGLGDQAIGVPRGAEEVLNPRGGSSGSGLALREGGGEAMGAEGGGVGGRVGGR